MQIVISIDGFSVTIHAPFPSGGLWEARKRIEWALVHDPQAIPMWPDAVRAMKVEREELLASADRTRELLAARVRWLERKLVEVAEIIESEPPTVVADTIWHDSTETLCDALRRWATNGDLLPNAEVCGPAPLSPTVQKMRTNDSGQTADKASPQSTQGVDGSSAPTCSIPSSSTGEKL
jgi:hypothetical protein